MDIGDNIIDSRDVISRIDELRDQFNSTPFGNNKYTGIQLQEILDNTPEEWHAYIDDFDELDELDELIALVSFQDDAKSATSEWDSGATFIHECYFREYAEELANNIGAVNSEEGWPNSYIDWDAAANALKMDYTTIESGCHTYHVRG